MWKWAAGALAAVVGLAGCGPAGGVTQTQLEATRAAVRPMAGISVTSSPNWAGYTVGGGPFQSVSAYWTVPAGHCGSGASQAAFWVGLDMTTVEQTGVALRCRNGTRSYSGWYQMSPSAPVGFSNHVRAGDHMMGSVSYHNGGRFTLRLADITEHWTRVVTVISHRSPRATAEVISEASYGSLAKFGTVHFSDARVNGHLISRGQPRRIDMAASRRERAVTGGLWPGANFDVTWRRG
jgi:Peptidase A4 family